MVKIKTLKNWSEDKSQRVPIAPRTHVKAVYDDNGNTLDSLLGVQDEKISELGSEVEFSEENSTTIFNVGDPVAGSIVEGKFVRWYDGKVEDSTSGFSYVVWEINTNNSYAITARTIGALTALAVYKDVNDNYISYECVAKSGISTKYYKKRLNIPQNCAKIYFSSSDSYVKSAILQPINYAYSSPLKEVVEVIEKRIEDNHKEVGVLISEETERAISSEIEINKDIDSIKYDITGEVKRLYDYNNIDNWEIGNISNGVNASNASRIRTSGYFTIQGTGYFRRNSNDTDVLNSYSAQLYIYDKNKNYLGTLGLQNSTTNIYSTYPDAYLFRVCVVSFTGTLANILEYVPYLDYGEDLELFSIVIDANAVIPRLNQLEVNNPLRGKRILFVGDSVMRAQSSDYGWARIIGEANVMEWNNIAVGGSTIRRMEEGRHCILDDLKAESGDYDYIILQGGNNDASNNPSALNGTISEGYEGEYDVSLTYPAMEEMCRYALTHYANKKVGFLIGYIRGTGIPKFMEYMDNLIKICKKWGMPYLDLRECAGFNLANLELRSIYGNYLGSVDSYDENNGYSVDDIVNYNGLRYKANEAINAPAGSFDESKWTYIGTDYDAAHCNISAYKLSAPRIEAWIKSL